MKSWNKFIAAPILLALTFLGPNVFDDSLRNKHESDCPYEYFIRRGSVSLCSIYKLNDKEIEYVDSITNKSLYWYRKFAKENNLGHIYYSSKLYINIVNIEYLNDDVLKPKKRTLAKYNIRSKNLYITSRMFDKFNTDLPHEIAHFGNDNLDIKLSKEKDELLAKRFEEYFIANVYK